MKSAFKFDYCGREYTTLSLSEKTLAGIEISAMLRRITGKDYPICIDNILLRVQANKISIHGNLFFIPKQFLPLLNLLEDYIKRNHWYC